MRLQIFERDELEGGNLTSADHDGRRDSRLERFLPALHAKAPAVTGHEAGEIPLEMRRAEIVSACLGEFEEFVGHLRAHRVESAIVGARSAVAIAKESRGGLPAAAFQFGTKDVGRHVGGNIAPSRHFASVINAVVAKPTRKLFVHVPRFDARSWAKGLS